MRAALFTTLAIAACALLPAAVRADDPAAPPSGDFAIVGARVLTCSGDALEDGTVVVRKGRIALVGPRDEVEVPKDVPVVEGEGRTLMPAFVHVASRIGLSGNGGGNSNSVDPERTAADDVDPWADANARAAAAGFATLGLLPGAGIVGGEGVAFRATARALDGALLSEHAFVRSDVSLGPRYVSEMQKRLGAARKELDALAKWEIEHAEWKKKKAAAVAAKKAEKEHPKEPAKPKQSDGNDVYRRLLLGESALLCTVNDASEVPALESALGDERMRGEELRLYVRLGGDSYLAAARLADLGATCVVRAGRSTWTGTDHVFDVATYLRNAGIDVVLLPVNDGREGLRSFRYHLALTAAAGFGAENAIRASTADAARLLGVAGETGSIEKDRRADLVLVSGPAFGATSRIDTVWVDGVPVEEAP